MKNRNLLVWINETYAYYLNLLGDTEQARVATETELQMAIEARLNSERAAAA